MPTFTERQLRSICGQILEAAGVSRKESEIVSNSLVDANLMGHDSHGVLRLIRYRKELKDGRTRPNVEMRILRETPSTAMLDGNWGFGQVAARKAMELAIRKAKATGIGLVAITHCNHMGRVGEFSGIAAENDMIGIILSNSAGNNVAPCGGIDPLYGTNPLSVAIPSGLGRPILLDMSTSIVAGGKVRIAKARGERIPEGWIVDSQGRPSTNPADLYDDGKCIGALLPFGGAKGSGIGLVLEVLGGVLAGAGCGPESRGNGPIMMAIDVAAFMPVEEFRIKVDRFIMKVKSSRKSSGVSEILLAGEPEFNTREKRLREGIFVEDGTWKQVEQIAKDLRIELRYV
jgi:uncharacterized oxidoreductase